MLRFPATLPAAAPQSAAGTPAVADPPLPPVVPVRIVPPAHAELRPPAPLRALDSWLTGRSWPL